MQSNVWEQQSSGRQASTSRSTLTLATPGHVRSGKCRARDGGNGEDEEDKEHDRATSQLFNFPYASAYGIQIDLMQAVFGAIEEGKIGVFESPTGTGKSLSLICAAATWLEMDAQRALQGQMQDAGDGGSKGTGDGVEPDWVTQHNVQKRRLELQRHDMQLKERLAAARNRLARRVTTAAADHARKKQREEDPLSSDSEAEYLVDSPISATDRESNATDHPASFLSPAVRALMERTGSHIMTAEPKSFSSFGGSHDTDEDEPETTPKIIYASRTHSQISQFIGELKKTKFARSMDVTSVPLPGSEADDDRSPLRCVSLGSRRQMCIHSGVQRLGVRRGVEAMNEKCLDLIKGKSKQDGPRCAFLPAQTDAGRIKMLDFRDAALAEVRDIEDLVELGTSMKTCPYFGSRASARQAQVIAVPYNLLLNMKAREALNLNLEGSVVIIDEAHNLIDTILSVHSTTVSSEHIAGCMKGAELYLTRFGSRLKGINEVNLKKLLRLFRGLTEYCAKIQGGEGLVELPKQGKGAEASLTTSEFLKRIGGNIDQLNLIELERWLRETKIAHKIAGYAEREEVKSRKAGEPFSKSTVTSAMHAVESLLLALVNRDVDGRIFASVSTTSVRTGTDLKTVVMLKYQLLNPADIFVDVAKEARAVILAGGTMEPFSDFETQLFTGCDQARLMRFSCGHIIPPSNLLAAVVCKGMTGKQLEIKYEARGNSTMLDEITGCLVNYCNVVPGGIVVFVPSYAFLDELVSRWKNTKGLERIEARKKIFLEPKNASEVDGVLQEYSRAIDQPTPGRTGALILAVVGAKLSEGINFSDQLGRAVIMIGMPFANAASAELAERMKYVRGLPANAKRERDAGQELYVNLCMKAVNQSIGGSFQV